MRPATGMGIVLAASAAVVLFWQPPGDAAAPLPGAVRLDAPVAGLSGVACARGAPVLFVVGDRGDVAEVGYDGAVRRSWRLGGDLEDVAILPSGDLLVLDEGKARIIRFDPRAGEERRRWALDTRGLLGRPVTHRDGFEGLEFRADGAAGGGLLYLAHQRQPAMVVVARFDPGDGGRLLDEDDVVARWSLEEHVEIKAITWVPALGAFAVVADERDLILILSVEGEVMGSQALDGLQQEGACVDDAGTLWVADDRGRTLFRIPGAVERLARLKRTR